MYDVEWLSQKIKEAAPMKAQQALGEAYYRKNNTFITGRTKEMYDGAGNLVPDPYKANHKLASGFMSIIVDQKVQYSLNDKMTSETDIDAILGTQWKNDLQKAGETASKKGFACWQMWLDGSKVRYKKIAPEQIIPCYDADNNLEIVIRTYATSVKGKITYMAEVYDAETVTKFTKETDEDWKCAELATPPITSTVSYGEHVDGEDKTGWGVVPFVIFSNNEYRDTDLHGMKSFIDAYDVVNSDFVNNLEDFQDSWWIIKNFDGQNLAEFLENLKKSKAMKVGDEGDVKRETEEVPHESRMVCLESIRGDIYEFSFSVDTSSVEGNVTNVRIISMYSKLDLKANKFEMEATSFIDNVIKFHEKGASITQDDIDKSEVVIVYDRSIIVNEIETSTLANESIGAISEETRLANDPRVKDVAKEIEMMAPIKAARIE